MSRIFAWIDKLPRWLRLAIKSYAISLSTIFLIAAEPILQSYFDPKTPLYGLAKFSVWFLWIGAITFAYLFFEDFRRVKEELARQRDAVIGFAHERVDRWLVKGLAAERESPLVQYSAKSAATLTQQLRGSLFLLVEGLYDALESHFAARTGIDRTEFEVTYMTKSLADGGITIAAWASSAHRAPRSLTMRSGNPDLYNTTVTAKIFNMPRPEVVVIPDTASDEDYAEVYAGQKSHIKSTVIYPVLDEANSLVGTIVCHCDLPGFFKRDEMKFWSRLVEIFARPIALTTNRTAQLVEHAPQALARPW